MELIPTETNELLINPPAYQFKGNTATPANGWLDDQFLVVKQRLFSANEDNGNYIVTAFLGITAASVNAAFTNGTWIITPTIPSGKRLVIQTISYSRNVSASGTLGQMAITTTVNATQAQNWAPELYNDGAPYPSNTAAVTIYADPGTTPSIAFVRSGSTSVFEASTAAVSGYYAAVK